MFLFDVEKESKRKKQTFTTVHQRADALRYIDELAKNRVGKFTTIDKANAISECEKFDFAVNRTTLLSWIKNRDVIFANAERFKPSSKFAPNRSKVKPQQRLLSIEQIEFEIELCSILYSELDRRNLSIEFIKERAKLLADEKYPTLKPRGRLAKNGHFNEDYCYSMLLLDACSIRFASW